MPWVNEDLCVGCGVCVDDCPVDAITLKEDQKAVINEDKCIRCGRCHNICPQEAVRHDSERIPEQVAANVEKTRILLQYYKSPDDQQSLLERMVRYFKKEEKVAGLTIDKLTAMKADFANARKSVSPDSSDS
jgi:ferredoxin